MGMGINELRSELLGAREHILRGDTDQGLQRLDHAIQGLEDRLLTTTEAKEWLGVGSVNTLKVLVRKAGLKIVTRGNRMMIPLSQLELLQDSPLLRGIRLSDQLHDASADLGGDRELSDKERDILEESRPGKLPWSDVR
jgi:hypothetical protein